MTRRNKIYSALALLICIVIAASLVYDPYNRARVDRAKIEAEKCDRDAISYLADYYEKNSNEKEIAALLDLARKCER